ncbi:sulfite exporter TauE/SafE family protein [Aquabacterium sp. J223]|uniref:sulfite exporter TauE/SafE family protein n=1 Tax=Aquabacterium sp. J223 TaxID=2898431 RepID=UPI0021AD9604|nr:sulfite exporter TauE/SafE family protein [Aquabacterium sp. J223]UUX95300.1 sulfite exporter TauE/SafE family protein [Aquabacterium sp. J223]
MDATLAGYLALCLLAGACVKGALGIGLPLVALPLMSQRIPAAQAIVMVMMPVLVSNAWQAFSTGFSAPALRRFWPLLVPLVVSTALASRLTVTLPDATLRMVLAGCVLLAVLLLSLQLRLTVPPERERWWSLGVGLASGLMGGMSALTGPLVITYLQALRLSREMFVRSVSGIYLASAIPLYAALAVQGRVSLQDLGWSTAALVPVGLGLAIGQWLRGGFSERTFRHAILAFLTLVSLSLLVR